MAKAADYTRIYIQSQLNLQGPSHSVSQATRFSFGFSLTRSASTPTLFTTFRIDIASKDASRDCQYELAQVCGRASARNVIAPNGSLVNFIRQSFYIANSRHRVFSKFLLSLESSKNLPEAIVKMLNVLFLIHTRKSLAYVASRYVNYLRYFAAPKKAVSKIYLAEKHSKFFFNKSETKNDSV